MYKLGWVMSFDFNQSGQMIVAIDYDGYTLVTEVDSNRPICDVKLESYLQGYGNRSKWCPLPKSPEIALKFAYHKLNVLNLEKQILIHHHPIELEKFQVCKEIEIHHP